MSNIAETFDRLRERREKALVGFVTAGDPNIPESLEIIEQMCRCGVDILELGVPFSDPTADGPVIQRSSARAIKAGANLPAVLGMVGQIRKFSEVPIVLFSYYNPILACGTAGFYRDCLRAGVDGVLVVDLPPEESDELTASWGDDLDFIRLVAPTTPLSRMTRISANSSGFIYLVSMTGVTGSGGLDLESIGKVAAELKVACGELPVCVGFGISTPQQVRQLCPVADGVVIGSAFESVIEASLGKGDAAGRVGELVREMKAATLESGLESAVKR
ncbi:MAG: tryptophan synthase subunit alpha [Syntrophobacteraceae bacterium]